MHTSSSQDMKKEVNTKSKTNASLQIRKIQKTADLLDLIKQQQKTLH